MEMEKRLAKIDSAEMGCCPDRPFLFGLWLSFSGQDWGVADGGRYSVNISPACRWGSHERYETTADVVDRVAKLLGDAKVNYVSQLKGKPVEIAFDGNAFKDFRILTEVL